MTATPFFQIVGSESYLDPDKGYVYDSLTMDFPFDYTKTKILAGDTTSMQTYRLHRLTEHPLINYNEPCIYNNYNLSYEPDALASLSLRLEKDYLSNPAIGNTGTDRLRFKLNDNLGRELFQLKLAQDSIFKYPTEFIRYFKGLAIVPDPSNSALIPIDISLLSLKCHFHLGSDNTTGSFTLPAYAMNSELGQYYAFTNLKNTPTPWLDGVNWKNSVPFTEARQAVIQGLNGYAIRMKLPFIANTNAYTTILKAEIILKPIIGNAEDIPELKNTSLQVFTLDKNLRLTSILTDLSGNGVYSSLIVNPNYQDSKSYVIDITDYYNTMITSGSATDPQLNILIGLRGAPTQIGYDETKTMVGAVATTFDRVVVDELPTLRIYYAKYK